MRPHCGLRSKERSAGQASGRIDIGERDVSDLKRLGLYNRIAAYMAEAVLQGDPLTVPEALRFAYLSPDDAVADRLALSRAEIDGLEAIVAAYLSGTWKAA